MKILITGGAGYVGLELAYALASRADVGHVTIYDRLNRNNYNMFTGKRKFEGAKLSLIEDDILNTRALDRAIAQNDVIYHCAAQTPTQNFFGASHVFEQNNQWGTACVVDGIAKSTSPKLLVNLSSLVIFGNQDLTSSLQTPTPNDVYSISKYRAEKQLERLAENAKARVINIRSPIVFGYSKNLRIDQTINRMVFDARMKGRVQVFGGSEYPVPHIYMPDLISLLSSITSYEGKTRDIIPNPQMISVENVYQALVACIDNLEITLVDQGAYSLTPHFSSQVATYPTERLRRSLEEQVEEFIHSFI